MWWRQPPARLASSLDSSERGLDEALAARALQRWGPNVLVERARPHLVADILGRLRNPLILLLLAATAISAATGDVPSAVIVAVVIAASLALDLGQARRAEGAVERLRAMVHVQVRVRRGGAEREIPATGIVPGDVLVLAAGDLVPADGVLLAARDVYVNQSSLTGEAFPVEKHALGEGSEAEGPEEAAGALLAGSHLVSGSATLLACETGPRTRLGTLAALVAARTRPSPLEEGTRDFGLMLMRLTFLMVLFVLLVNALFARPMLESFMFAVALAVGLTPELLPMVVSVTLARGATRLAREEVIVKQPAAIYALGAMDVLATDKTGTLTEGRIELERHLDVAGAPSERVLHLAYVNSLFESGLHSPLDEAILRHRHLDVAGWKKVDEVPFDFERRRVSILADAPDGRRLLVVKGAPEELLARCNRCDLAGTGGPVDLDAARRESAQALYESLGEEGLRVLAICWREVGPHHDVATLGDEERLVLAGFAAFLDPAREDSREALAALAARGVGVKILTGDNERVARHLCTTLGIPAGEVLLGHDVERLDAVALAAAAAGTTLFCRVSPAQKTRIVEALRVGGHIVGFMGDGINDAPALRAADVGISVDGAVDVAKDAADVILLRHHLMVVVSGILEGRRSYANVVKYLRMGTSSNFGNMFSMAAATLFLPFLPLLPVQVLLNNLLYELSETALPFDRVEDADLSVPCRWDLQSIRRFMFSFGPLSSLFDVLTFATLLWVFQAGPELFRTGWFIESVASQVLVVFAIRSFRPAWRSAPHPALFATAFAATLAAAALPFTALGAWAGFTPPPATLLAVVAALVAAYLLTVEMLKSRLANRGLAPN